MVAQAGAIYIPLPELTQQLNKKPALAGKLLSAVLEKEGTLFPSEILNPASGHANPIVCIQAGNLEPVLKAIQTTGLKFQKDPDGKICK